MTLYTDFCNKSCPTDFHSERIPTSITEAMFEDQRGQHRANLLETKQNVDEQVIKRFVKYIIIFIYKKRENPQEKSSAKRMRYDETIANR